jgi:hypothetical protein
MSSCPLVIENNTAEFEVFFDAYTVLHNHIDDNASLGGCMFETYDSELEFVKAQNPECVWTYMSFDDQVIITQGFHMFNRMGYLVTKDPIKDSIKDYVSDML